MIVVTGFVSMPKKVDVLLGIQIPYCQIMIETPTTMHETVRYEGSALHVQILDVYFLSCCNWNAGNMWHEAEVIHMMKLNDLYLCKWSYKLGQNSA
jgi:hypothetical protein